MRPQSKKPLRNLERKNKKRDSGQGIRPDLTNGLIQTPQFQFQSESKMKRQTRIITVAMFCATAISGPFFLRSAADSNPFTEFQQQTQADSASAQIYQDRCASCHENPQGRIPPRFLIARRSAEDVIQTLTSGA